MSKHEKYTRRIHCIVMAIPYDEYLNDSNVVRLLLLELTTFCYVEMKPKFSDTLSRKDFTHLFSFSCAFDMARVTKCCVLIN